MRSLSAQIQLDSANVRLPCSGFTGGHYITRAKKAQIDNCEVMNLIVLYIIIWLV